MVLAQWSSPNFAASKHRSPIKTILWITPHICLALVVLGGNCTMFNWSIVRNFCCCGYNTKNVESSLTFTWISSMQALCGHFFYTPYTFERHNGKTWSQVCKFQCMFSWSAPLRHLPKLLFHDVLLYVLSNFQGRKVELNMHAAIVHEYCLTY